MIILLFLIHNIAMEDNYLIRQIVSDIIDDFLKRTEGICASNSCRERMLNKVTERLAARYKFTEKDLPYVRIQGGDIQLKADAVKELNNVIRDNSEDCYNP